MREKREDLELVRTVVLARHGARSTLCYLEELGPSTWNDPKLFEAPDFVKQVKVNWTDVGGGDPPKGQFSGGILPCGGQRGELTRRGYIGNSKIGEYIKTQIEIKEEDIYVRSTNTTRTVESARAIIAGIFNKKMEITIETPADNYDDFLTLHNSAKKAMANLEWTWSTPCLYEPFQEKMSKIIQTVGLKKRADGRQSQFQPIGVYDDYMCRKEHDLIIHNKEKLDSVAEDLEELAVLTKHIINGISDEERQFVLSLKAGRLLEYIVKELKKPLSILSVHDTTLGPMHQALTHKIVKQTGELCIYPPYSAHMDFYFYKNANNEEFIQVDFQREPILFNGKAIVPIKEFLEETAWFRMTNEEFEEKKQAEAPIPARFSQGDEDDFHKNPEKYLKIE